MKQQIINEINKIEGSLLGIGIEDPSMLDAIEKNDKINLCYILTKGNKFNKKNSPFLKEERKKQ